MTITEDAVREELKKVIDPELLINVVDLGLIYTVNLETTEQGATDIKVEMTLTSPTCPVAPQLIAECKAVIGRLTGVGDVDVKVVLSPPWSPDRMSEEARDELGMF